MCTVLNENRIENAFGFNTMTSAPIIKIDAHDKPKACVYITMTCVSIMIYEQDIIVCMHIKTPFASSIVVYRQDKMTNWHYE